MRRSRLLLILALPFALALGCGDSNGGDAGNAGTGGVGGTAAGGGAGGEEQFPEPYAANLCVGAKQQAAADFCESMFAAQADWLLDQDGDALSAARDSAANTLAAAWDDAEEAARDDDANCEDLALESTDAGSSMGARIELIADAVTDGLDLTESVEADCGADLLEAAGTACKDLLEAEGAHVSNLHADPERSTLGAARQEAFDAFSNDWDGISADACPTNATSDRVRDELEGLTDTLVQQTVVTPGVDGEQFISLVPGPTEYLGRTYTPQCMQGSEYRYFAKRGSVNKLLMYYQGGGACWDNLTCGGTLLTGAICATSSTEEDNPNNFSSGFADLDNENNPFADWHIVFVSYCSCDVHFGDAEQPYSDELTVQHKGYHNSKVAEKWAREHFLNPEQVFVTGSSAGAYGAWFNGPLLHEVWPASQIHVLADAGNGVITTDFLRNEFSHWNFIANLPDDVPGVQEAITEGTGMPAYTEAVAKHFPDTNWAHYSTLYDGGGGGQTGFYNVMLEESPIGALRWWDASCQFGETALAQSKDTFAEVPSNYRYYFGTGSRHTMWGNDKVYDETTGNVPTIVSWVEAMLASKPGQRDARWTNVECENCGLLLEGDPAPGELQPPFTEQSGSTVIVCEE